jgi:stearoyl-CoA desaturase (delta-9 desaturase)
VSRAERISNLGAVILPFAAFAAAIALLWNSAIDASQLAILGVMYVVVGLGVTVGFHRLLTHRSFATSKPLEYAFAVIGSMSVQGPVISWVADHRKHHAHTDAEGDPHSPHLHERRGFRGVLAGLWHAHMGWFLASSDRADPGRYARDLLDDRGMRAISAAFPAIVALGLAIPFGAGLLVTGTLAGGLLGLLWGGLVRVFLLHHVTWSINSVCHFFGSRRFDTEDRSTNVFWLALPSFGESWHHNHHAFPRSAEHGLRRWELDPSSFLIRALERLGLAWNVVRISPERQAARTVAGPGGPAEAPSCPAPIGRERG